MRLMKEFLSTSAVVVLTGFLSVVAIAIGLLPWAAVAFGLWLLYRMVVASGA